ncbi:MAG: ferrous iron transport protein A [Flavobacteriaceae bacterium]|nr:ferrous iron transport protein A [Flavobacteriaceae bacterium]
MLITVDELVKGDRAIIKKFDARVVPLKLIEMGCIEGSYVELVQHAPFSDPVYLNINGTYLAIRRETAAQIQVERL